jgi:protoporphyrinogen oxidase
MIPSPTTNQAEPYIVVGAGLSGLAACLELERRGHSCLLLESTSEIGGKLKTEVFEDKYLLDHGFQVLLPSYSELRRVVDLDKLKLQYFNAGAMIRIGRKWTKISDPLRNPTLLLETLFSTVGNFKDKLLVLKLRLAVLSVTEEDLLQTPLASSIDFLKSFGFSSDMIENFWNPFFSGIFLESELKTEASFFKFLFKMFAQSPVALPAKGVGHLPAALFSKLKATELRLNTQVKCLENEGVVLENGSRLKGKVIDARPAPSQSWGSVSTLYFSAETSPIKGPWLMLNSKRNKFLVNHVAVVSEVSRDYASQGDALISVNVIRPLLSEQDFAQVNTELKEMYGVQTQTWRFLKSFEIPRALPLYHSLPMEFERQDTPSQQGALLKGRRRVEQLFSDIG